MFSEPLGQNSPYFSPCRPLAALLFQSQIPYFIGLYKDFDAYSEGILLFE